MSASGPLYGTAAALAATAAGLALTAAGVGGVAVEPSAFEDSLLVGLLGTFANINQLHPALRVGLTTWQAVLLRPA